MCVCAFVQRGRQDEAVVVGAVAAGGVAVSISCGRRKGAEGRLRRKYNSTANRLTELLLASFVCLETTDPLS